MEKISFQFELDILQKSVGTAQLEGLPTDESGNWKIRGVASAPTRDIEGDFLDPHGMNTGNLRYFNYDHKSDPKYIVGEISRSWIDDEDRFWVEGILYKTSEIARQIVELAVTLAKESLRKFKLGFSVEGSVLERDTFQKHKITKSVVNSIAIAPFPVNTVTWAEVITKGIQTRELEYEMESANVYASCSTVNGEWICINSEKIIKSCDGSKIEGLHKAMQEAIDKGEVDEKRIHLFKKEVEEIKKAIEAGSTTGMQNVNKVTSGPSLKSENSERDLKYLDVQSDELQKAQLNKKLEQELEEFYKEFGEGI